MQTRLPRAVLVVMIAMLAVGCAPTTAKVDQPQPTAQPGPPLAPRPFELHVDHMDPCATLTLAQLASLALHFQDAEPADANGGPTCFWAHTPEEPVEGYSIRLNTSGGVEQTFGNPRGVSATTVAGFPAVETQNYQAPRDTTCIVGVDVADGQGVQVNYTYNGSTLPMARDIACQKAKAVAEMAMQTLLTRAGG
jgi:hypothetical protein